MAGQNCPFSQHPVSAPAGAREQDDHHAVLRGKVPTPQRKPVVTGVADVPRSLDPDIDRDGGRLPTPGMGEVLAHVKENSMATAVFPAGCFGKLPLYGDFVRHNASGRETLAFDQWLHQEMHHARTNFGHVWEQAFESAPTYNFVFVPEEAGRFLVGVLHPSHDKGKRRYPFMASLLVDRPRFKDAWTPVIPVLFSDFLARGRQKGLCHAPTMV